MTKPGIISTFLLFGRHKNQTTSLPDRPYDEDDEDLFDDLFGRRDLRMLTATIQQKKEMTLPHVLIKGSLSFENHYGFLNSD